MAEQADAMVSKTIGRQLSCRFDPDLRQNEMIAELCSGSTADFESVCPGSNPGSAATWFRFEAHQISPPGNSFISGMAVKCFPLHPLEKTTVIAIA